MDCLEILLGPVALKTFLVPPSHACLVRTLKFLSQIHCGCLGGLIQAYLFLLEEG